MTNNKKQVKNVGTLFTPPVVVSIAVLAVILLLTIFAGAASKYDPEAVNMGSTMLKPSLEHLLGTDNIGRDQFTRLLYGAARH
jgi:peptide/nickel transport system permease protein